jgi:CubicO group peptidase (beta-lactamase class C family)
MEDSKIRRWGRASRHTSRLGSDDRRLRAARLILVVLASVNWSLSCAQSKTDTDTDKVPRSIAELRGLIEGVLKDTHTPAVAVAIVHRNGPEWITALGTADLASGRAASEDTLFRLGSMGKGVTALAVLTLVDQGKLSLDDRVHKWAPDLAFDNRWETTDALRVVNLLEHTTGWDGTSASDVVKDAPGITLRAALASNPASLVSRWRPGTRMGYSNTNYGAAAYVVEKVTGERFEDYVQRAVFEPIGMVSATFLRPDSKAITTNYHTDGRTPFPYWNFLYRPAGTLNASATDIANYLLFYLNRGSVNGTQILPSTLLDRMETPTTTWEAKAGLKFGYGLGNYLITWTAPRGRAFVGHGHGGGIPGGLSDMAYLAEYDVGYFCAINSENEVAIDRISRLLQTYITRDLPGRPMPAVTSLPKNADNYAGWYEPDSPRFQINQFRERLLGLSYISVDGSILRSLTWDSGKGELEGESWLPAGDNLFRRAATDPMPNIVLLPQNTDGRLIQTGWNTRKHIPAWFAVGEIAITVFVLVAAASSVAYAPFWLIRGRHRNRRRAERPLRIVTLIGSSSLIAFLAIASSFGGLASDDLGRLTVWSLSLFLTNLFLLLAAAAAVLVWWRASAPEVRRTVRWHSLAVTLALIMASLYFAFWGLLGVRT